ncbi:TPA: tetratricopeptide repeat protein [Legionella pneumophila]|nr:tetratricopeptide repeat protein [Legionella pneumophila]HAT8257724.1 tetratricopeptide repeat protein [Legionella pneumophila]HAT8260970.1 tetratricopeptide repeat protein [Legionella pneumophila]HAT8267013.1 tetratricopeptide repeat protein [Legionella pneumophila]HAT8270299.1 tetratricopeptide repeat protein [Legionella pneumophila]
MRKKKLVTYGLLFVCIAGVMIYSAIKKTRSVQRDIPTLLNFYYNYKEKNPLKAKDALDLILKQDPLNAMAIHAKSNWFIQQGDTHSALVFLQHNHTLYPNDANIEFELANLYIMLNQRTKAKPILKKLITSNNQAMKQKAIILYQSLFPQEAIQAKPIIFTSFIEPVRLKAKQDLAPLYAKVQEIIKLQPDSARRYLQMIISMYPNEFQAYAKLGYLELQQNNPDTALQYFLKAFAIKADAQLAVQIGYLYAKNNDFDQSLFFFNYGIKHGNDLLKQQSIKAIAFLKKSSLEIPSKNIAKSSLSPEDKLWASFYETKIKQPSKALRTINTLLRMHPNDIKTLKEAAYFAMAQKNSNWAIALWLQAYNLEKNPDYALSIAYLYDAQNNKPKAFHFFDLASKTTDMNIKTKAELAMTNMGGAQFQFLPKPYFAEFYTAPFYFSRFDLGVLPTITRTGVTVNESYHTDMYLSWRRTKDNRSGTIQGLIIQNSISQIFEDNVAIYAAGFRTYPWPQIPLQTFLEVGQAQDLVYRNRPEWRSDIRGGLVYYNAWGERPTWTAGLKFPWKWVSTLYADTIFYSRYDNNIIGTAWFRPGFRVATFQSAQLDMYLANYLILDKNQEFFNNTYSIGPGVAFQPSNRLNVIFRFESLQGYYIPVNSPTPNPYRSKYYNNLAMIEVYFRF